MKTIATQLLTVLALLPGAVRAQDVKAIVAAMPAATVQDETAGCAQLVKLGPAAIKEICAGLSPLDGEDDTKTRYAISALARYCGRPGAEAERMMLCKALCESLSGAKDVEIKVFLIERLEMVACDGAAATLAPLLGDDKFVAPAARALTVINTPAAAKAIADALTSAPESRLLTLVQSAGALRIKEAIPAIEKSAASTQEQLRMTSIQALANIGAPSALGFIEKAPKSNALIESQLRQATLLHAARLAEAGQAQQATAICMGIIKSPARARADCGYISGAIHLLGKIAGEGALPALVTAAQDAEAQVRAAALTAALSLQAPAATSQFAALLASAAPPVKVDVLNYLARRGDKSATDAVLAASKDPDVAVRLAAADALVKLGGEGAIDPLVAMLKSGPAEQVRPVAELIARMKGEKAMAALAGSVADAPAAGQAAIIDVLALRPTSAGKDAVFNLTSSKDVALRTAAFKALEKLADANDVPRLVALALGATEAAEETAALRAANIAAAPIASEARADAFLAALSKAQGPKRAAILKAVGKAGGPKAMAALSGDLKSADAATKDAALRALAESFDPGAIAPLMTIAGDAAAPLPQQVIALRGAVQVVRNSTLPSDQKVKHLAAAMSIAKRPDEKRAILSALSTEHTLEALALAAPLLEDAGLKAEAALAIIRIAAPAERGAKTLAGPQAVEALKKAIPLCPDARAKADGQKHLGQIDKKPR